MYGFDQLTFINLKSYIQDNNLLFCNDYSKDNVATILNISTENSHSSKRDCEIEREIIGKVLKLHSEKPDNSVFNDLIMNNLNKDKAAKYYERLVKFCRDKNGLVTDDYDSNPKKRGKEWIQIHHIDETTLDNIGVRTDNALSVFPRDIETLCFLKKFNKKERLVYATTVEHFLLHYLIEFIRPSYGFGPHWLFGYILRAKFNVIKYNYEKNIFKNFDLFFENISFEEICFLYKKIIKLHNLDKQSIISYFKIDNITNEIDEFVNSLFAD